MKTLSPISPGAIPWLQTGYGLFSEEGPDGIQVERLARIMSRNKSGFYHFFGERDTYLDYLSHYHLDHMKGFLQRLETIGNFDPEFLQLLVENRTSMLFNVQLVRFRQVQFCADLLAEVNERIDRYLLPAWTKYFKLEADPSISKQLYEIMRDVYFSRINPRDYNIDFLRRLATESTATISQLLNVRTAQMPVSLVA